jgi:hypothetical protein
MMAAPFAPIALFVYNRPAHLRRVLDALALSPLAARSELHVFSDAARNVDGESAVAEVRSIIAKVTGFARVFQVMRDHNLGLANSIIDGVGRLCSSHGRVIVLEDDLLVSPYFLGYMNDALNLYENDERVISAHGYVYPVKSTMSESFFLRGADCWGWATWKRGWELFEPDGAKLLDQLIKRSLLHRFDFNGACAYSDMLRGQISGLNDSWAVRWYASALLNDKLTLYPARSLVQNIGNDASGRHGANTPIYDTEACAQPVRVGGIPVEENLMALNAFEKFFRASRPSLAQRINNRLKKYLTLPA